MFCIGSNPVGLRESYMDAAKARRQNERFVAGLAKAERLALAKTQKTAVLRPSVPTQGAGR